MTLDDDLVQVRQLLWENRARLPIFTVYDHPRDLPDFFVARLWLTLPGPATATGTALCDRSLTRLQATLDGLGLVKLMRSPGDDPVILETWL